MRLAISNPEKILRLLDGKLTKPMELTIYGRAALALGFAHPKADFLSTKDVDAVIPICTLDAFRENDEFWNAQEEINKELEPHGLYITHLSPMQTSSYGLIGQNIEFQSQWISRTFAFIDLLR
jgi:hypothetical protein